MKYVILLSGNAIVTLLIWMVRRMGLAKANEWRHIIRFEQSKSDHCRCSALLLYFSP